MKKVLKPDRSVSPTGVQFAQITGLDGLRAIAVLAVIAHHFLPNVAVGGFVGVDIFFVISGFLITGLLVRQRRRTGAIGLRSFWLRRARRLLPALVLVVAGCSATAFFIRGAVIVGLGRQVLGAATFSSNWLAIARGSSYFSSTNPELFRNLWSLAVEEQFYLLWPLLMLLIRSRAVRVGIASAIAAGSAVAMTVLAAPDPPGFISGRTPTASGWLSAPLSLSCSRAPSPALSDSRAAGGSPCRSPDSWPWRESW